MGRRLFLIDASSNIYRAFFALPALSNSRGPLAGAGEVQYIGLGQTRFGKIHLLNRLTAPVTEVEGSLSPFTTLQEQVSAKSCLDHFPDVD